LCCRFFTIQPPSFRLFAFCVPRFFPPPVQPAPPFLHSPTSLSPFPLSTFVKPVCGILSGQPSVWIAFLYPFFFCDLSVGPLPPCICVRAFQSLTCLFAFLRLVFPAECWLQKFKTTRLAVCLLSFGGVLSFLFVAHCARNFGVPLYFLIFLGEVPSLLFSPYLSLPQSLSFLRLILFVLVPFTFYVSAPPLLLCFFSSCGFFFVLCPYCCFFIM